MLLDLGREAEHPHDLTDPRPSDSLPSGDLCLVQDLAGVKQRLPHDGPAEELDDPGRLGLLGRSRPAPGFRQSTDDPIGRHVPRHRAHVAVLEGLPRSRGDLDSLFAAGVAKCAVVAVRRDVDDPEPDLGLRDAAPVSRLTRSGSEGGRLRAVPRSGCLSGPAAQEIPPHRGPHPPGGAMRRRY